MTCQWPDRRLRGRSRTKTAMLILLPLESGPGRGPLGVPGQVLVRSTPLPSPLRGGGGTLPPVLGASSVDTGGSLGEFTSFLLQKSCVHNTESFGGGSCVPWRGQGACDLAGGQWPRAPPIPRSAAPQPRACPGWHSVWIHQANERAGPTAPRSQGSILFTCPPRTRPCRLPAGGRSP